MRIKTFLIMVLSLASLTAFAQGGGVKGKVVSRTTRAAIDGVKVILRLINWRKANTHLLLKQPNSNR